MSIQSVCPPKEPQLTHLTTNTSAIHGLWACLVTRKISNLQDNCENKIKNSLAWKRYTIHVSFLPLSFIEICKLGVKVIKRISTSPRLAFCGAAQFQGSLINTHRHLHPHGPQLQQQLITSGRSQGFSRPPESYSQFIVLSVFATGNLNMMTTRYFICGSKNRQADTLN